MGEDLAGILLSEDQLQTRLDEIAAQVDADYAGRDLLLVGVLKGAIMVMADLARRLHLPVEMDWMAVSSYGAGTSSSGVVRILKDLDTDLSGRHVLIVEDIVDSGLTLSWLLSNLRSRNPASVEIMTMLRKPEAAKVEVDVRYVGFEIPTDFVVGYGLDYAEKYRNLPRRTSTPTDRAGARSRPGRTRGCRASAAGTLPSRPALRRKGTGQRSRHP